MVGGGGHHPHRGSWRSGGGQPGRQHPPELCARRRQRDRGDRHCNCRGACRHTVRGIRALDVRELHDRRRQRRRRTGLSHRHGEHAADPDGPDLGAGVQRQQPDHQRARRRRAGPCRLLDPHFRPGGADDPGRSRESARDHLQCRRHRRCHGRQHDHHGCQRRGLDQVPSPRQVRHQGRAAFRHELGTDFDHRGDAGNRLLGEGERAHEALRIRAWPVSRLLWIHTAVQHHRIIDEHERDREHEHRVRTDRGRAFFPPARDSGLRRQPGPRMLDRREHPCRGRGLRCQVQRRQHFFRQRAAPGPLSARQLGQTARLYLRAHFLHGARHGARRGPRTGDDELLVRELRGERLPRREPERRQGPGRDGHLGPESEHPLPGRLDVSDPADRSERRFRVQRGVPVLQIHDLRGRLRAFQADRRDDRRRRRRRPRSRSQEHPPTSARVRQSALPGRARPGAAGSHDPLCRPDEHDRLGQGPLCCGRERRHHRRGLL